MNRSIALAALSLLCCLAASSVVQAAEVKLEQKENHVAVTVDGKPFTDYYFAAEGDHEYVRPFMYPVNAADGVGVTSDQIIVKGGDHPHHRSLWIAHGDIDGADHWSLNQKPVPVQRHLKFEKVEGDTLVEDLAWEGKGVDGKHAEPVLTEVRTVKFGVLPDGTRFIDTKNIFTPLIDKVTFQDTKEAGMVAVRMPKSVADTAVITTNVEGQGGEGKKGEAAAWGKPAAWCDLSGKIDGKDYGVAVFDHPTNPRHPSTWHVRQYGLLAANIFGQHEFDKTKPAHAGDFVVNKGQTVTFMYRVVIHTGAAKDAKLDEKYKAYVDDVKQ